MELVQQFYLEVGAGGFSRFDSTIAFYGRVNALLKPGAVLLDFGAGRGVGHLEDACDYRRSLINFRGRVQKVIGVDVDPAVLNNPALDETHMYNPAKGLPLDNASVDIIIADWAFEHILDPAHVARELERVLKPGSWICARTPNRYGYIAASNRLVTKTIKTKVLNVAQPSRKEEDVFPAMYLMNSFGALLRYFPKERFEHFSYSWDAEPAYHANNIALYRTFQIIHYLTPAPLRSMLMVFIRKRERKHQ